MNPETVLAMRKAAALSFAVPGLEVDISSGGQLIARIGRRFDCPHVPATTTLLTPCVFHDAVGRMLMAGNVERAMFLGLQPQEPIRLEYFMPFTGAAQPLGRILSRVGETVVHVFATTRSIADVAGVIAEIGPHPSISIEINCSRDERTQITLVFCESRISEVASVRPHIESMMDRAFLRIAVDEITDAVAAEAARSTGPF